MQTLTRTSEYTRDKVLRALRGLDGHRDWRFRYELLSAKNEHIRWMSSVLGGSVKNDIDQQIKRTATFLIRETGQVNYLNQRIRPWAGIQMPDGNYMEWPLGVFLLTTPKRNVDLSGTVTRDVQAYDQMMVLLDDLVPGRYFVGANVEYTAAVNELLSGTLGITSFSVVSSNTRTPSALEWEPGTSKAQIIADLLAAINYNSLWFDGEGSARAEPYVAPELAEAEFTYETDDLSVILPDAEVDVDYFKVPNRWVLIVSSPDQPPLRAEIINDSPFSPTSTVNRGRTITRVITDEIAPNQAVLNSIAARYRDEDGQLFETITFKTGIMPFHENGDVFDFAYFDLLLAGRFMEMSWSLDLEQGSEMEHTARRTISVLSGFGVGPFGLMPFGG
jgi:hypothetical protein